MRRATNMIALLFATLVVAPAAALEPPFPQKPGRMRAAPLSAPGMFSPGPSGATVEAAAETDIGAASYGAWTPKPRRERLRAFGGGEIGYAGRDRGAADPRRRLLSPSIE